MRLPLQLDLFADVAPPPSAEIRIVPETLSDAALIAALPDATLGDAHSLAAESARRRLADATPALVALCKRFVGYGQNRRVPEQIAALEALAAIGGAEASKAVVRMIAKQIVQGPNLVAAVVAASALGAKFGADVALPLLAHSDPIARAAACQCVRASGDVVNALVALLADRDGEVATAAACALGRMGRVEARDALKRSLHEKPSPRVIDALAEVADEDAIVLIARLGRKRPDLALGILSALDEIDHPKAGVAASALRSWFER